MNYFDFIYDDKNKYDLSKSKTINNIKINIDKYVFGGEYSYDGRRDYRYIIEFKNNDYIVPIIMEISLKEIWSELKDHIKLGTQVIGEGYMYYNNDGELIWIDIKKFYINNIEFQKIEVKYKGNDRQSKENLLNRLRFIKSKEINHNKSLVFLFLFIFGYSILSIPFFKYGMNKIGKIFLLLEVFHIILLSIYSIKLNKMAGKNAKNILESNGFKYNTQEYLRYSFNAERGKESYKEELIE